MALTLGTFLQQGIRFSFTDLSVLLDKVRTGDVRSVSGYGNNVVDPTLDRTVQPFLADGVTPNPAFDPALANGSAFNEFIRISGVNNYPGAGNLTPQQIADAAAAAGITLDPNTGLLPNERLISDVLSNQGAVDMPQGGGWNNLFMDMGQYIDHGLDFFNKGANGSYVINDGTLTPNPVGTISATRANGGVDGTYNNTLSNWINQSQTYGSEAAVTFLLTQSVRDAQGNLVRDANGTLLKTAKLLGGSGRMAANRIGNDPTGRPVDFPSGYDILINNGVNQALLDGYIDANLANSQLVQQWVNDVTAFLQFTQDPAAWAAANPGQPVPTNPNPTGSPMTAPANVQDAIGALQGGWAAIQADPNYVDLNGVVPGTVNQTLIGDMGFGAGFDPVFLMQHYVGGDLRANENVLLTSIHSLFHSSHNALVDGIYASLAELQTQIASSGITSLDQIDAGLRPLFSQVTPGGPITMNVKESEVFEMARTTMNGMYQRMVFDQYLTALVGGVPFGNPVAQDFINQPAFFAPLPVGIQEHGLNGFYPEVNAAISVEFNTAGFRVGHSQIYENIDYLQLTNGQLSYADLAASANLVAEVTGIGGVPLIEAFLSPQVVGALGGPASIVAGNAFAPAQQVDTYLHDVVRNLLVGRPNDLGAFNSMRGREIGLPTLQQFLQATTDLLQATGVASTLGTAASDTQAGLGQFVTDPNTGALVIGPDGLATQTNILAERLRPYTSWRDFGTTMRGANLDADGNLIAGSLLEGFMRLYATELFDGDPVAQGDTAGLATGNLIAGALDGAVGLDRVDLWIGMLAEAPVLTPNGPAAVPSMLGRTGTYIVAEQFDRLQDADLQYYKQSLVGADVFNQIAFQTFTAQIQAAFNAELATQFLHQDTFRRFEADNFDTNTLDYVAPTTAVIALEELLAAGGTLAGANPLLDPAALTVVLDALLLQQNADEPQPLLALVGTGALAGLPAAAAVALAELALEAPAQVATLEAQLLDALGTAGDVVADAAAALTTALNADAAAIEAFVAGGGDVVTFAGLDPALLPTAQLAVLGLRFDNRLIIANDRDNVIVGSAGWDDIRAGGGNDVVDAGDGIDFVYGQGGNDFLFAGNDALLDNIYGGTGNDVLLGALNSEDILFGDEGNDLLILNSGLVGGIGQGGAGADVILGGAGANIIRGDSGVGDGDDVLVGGAAGDDIVGGGGNDLVMGGQHDAPVNVLGADVGAIVLPAPDRLYGDHESSQNTEILARVLEQDASGNWSINEAKLLSQFGPNPLRLDIGTMAQLSAINPLTGELFSTEQRAAIDNWITGTRVVPQTTDATAPGYIDLGIYQQNDPAQANYLDPAGGPIDLNHPGLAGLQVKLRGPQVLTNWVGYAPSGNDTLVTSTTNGTYLEAVAAARGIAAGVTGTVQFLDANGELQTVDAANAVLNWAAEQLPATPVPARLELELAFGLNQAIFAGPIFDAQGNEIAGPLFDANGNPIAGFDAAPNAQGFQQITQPLFAAAPTAFAQGDILFDAAGGQFEVVNADPANFLVAQLDANGNPTGATFTALNLPPLTLNDPTDLGVDEELVPFVAPNPVTVQLRRPLVDQVFAGAGNDTVITDAHNDTLLFGGLGTDTLDYTSMGSVDVSLDINSQAAQPQGTDGVVVHTNTALDRFYSFEAIQFSTLGRDFNTVTLSAGAAQTDADLIAAARNGGGGVENTDLVHLSITGGVTTVLNGAPTAADGLKISGAEKFVLSDGQGDSVTFQEQAPTTYSVSFGISTDPALAAPLTTRVRTRGINRITTPVAPPQAGLVVVKDAAGQAVELLNAEAFVFDAVNPLVASPRGQQGAPAEVNFNLDAAYQASVDSVNRALSILLADANGADVLGLVGKSFSFDAAYNVRVNNALVLDADSGMGQPPVPATPIAFAEYGSISLGGIAQAPAPAPAPARGRGAVLSAPTANQNGSSAGLSWQTVSFVNSYVNPVVIISDPTANGADPVTARVQNVDLTAKTFQVALQEYGYLDGVHPTETLSWMVIESGTHYLADGSSFVAGTVDTNLLATSPTSAFADLGVASTGVTTLLTQVQTFNEADAVVTRTRVDAVTGSYQVAMQEQQLQPTTPATHATENIGYVAFKAAAANAATGVASAGDVLIEGGMAPGFTEQVGLVAFDQNFAGGSAGAPVNPVRGRGGVASSLPAQQPAAPATPPTVLTKVATFNDPDTANSRIASVTTTGFAAAIQKETSVSANVAVAPAESLGFLALEGPSGSLMGSTSPSIIGSNPMINNPAPVI